MSTKIINLLYKINKASCKCPSHSNSFFNIKKHATNSEFALTEYAFEMASSSLRYGPNVTNEVGKDFFNLGAKKVCVMTDKNLVQLPPVQIALESLHNNKILFELFDNVRIEPTDTSFKEAIDMAKRGTFDAYLAIGGGSVLDTCKTANLYASKPEADFWDFVTAPIGKNLPVTHKLKPLIAVPTTSGTGSETTGIAVFDYEEKKTKLGIASRAIKPMLGLVDPNHAMSLPQNVAIYSGFDVLCHALESFTALPYNKRYPRPSNPLERPAYQGSNPINDIWSKEALRIIGKYFKRSVFDREDYEARSSMHLAGSMAGMGFGNAGVHLCHGMSYAISGLVGNYKAEEYPQTYPLIPHGLSVCITAPAVFKYTYQMCPDRHLEAAKLLGADVLNIKAKENILSDQVLRIMSDLKIPNGLTDLGYTTLDIPALIEGTLPQERVLKISPKSYAYDDLYTLLEQSITIY